MNTPSARLGDLVTFKGGGTPSRNKASYWGGKIPWATVKDFNSGSTLAATQESISEDGLRNSASNLIQSGTVIIPTRMALGKAAINSVPLAINQDLKAVFPNKHIEPRYLLWFFLANAHRIESMGKGATVKGVTLDQLKRLELPLPPLPEQRRIAAILDQADALRTKRRAAIAKCDQLLQSVFLDMFGDPVTNPKGWPKRALVQVCEAIIDCPHSTPRWASTGMICLRTSNLTAGGWNWDDTRYVTPEDFEARSKRRHIEPGDIVLSREGTVGIAAIVPTGLKVCMGQRLVQVRADSEKLLPPFLLQLLLHDLSPDRIGRLMVGSTAKHLNVRELKQLPVLLPPLSLQTKFERVVSSLLRQKEVLDQGEAALGTLFSCIQQRAFTGQLSPAA